MIQEQKTLKNVTRETFIMKKIGKNKGSVGIEGENIAKKWLISKGYNIVTQNFVTYHGEIDIIANKNKVIFFVEVKAVSISHKTVPKISPLDNFTLNKFNKMNKAIEYYLMKNNVQEKVESLLLCIYIDKEARTAHVQAIPNPIFD